MGDDLQSSGKPNVEILHYAGKYFTHKPYIIPGDTTYCSTPFNNPDDIFPKLHLHTYMHYNKKFKFTRLFLPHLKVPFFLCIYLDV